MTEFAFRPAVLRLASGRPARLVLANRGQIAHQFETEYLLRIPTTVIGEALHIEATGVGPIRVQPGGWARLDFVPRRTGRFRFACTIEGHREAGMEGVLEIR